MKWKELELGDMRTKKVFALIPLKIKGYWYWLEFVEKEQEYTINGWKTKFYQPIK